VRVPAAVCFKLMLIELKMLVYIFIFPGFAQEVRLKDLPFIVNWCGPDVKTMEVNDDECLLALVKIIRALDDLQPKIEGRFILKEY
jgi:hypothetical protein